MLVCMTDNNLHLLPKSPCVVYLDQLLGAAGTLKLVELLYFQKMSFSTLAINLRRLHRSKNNHQKIIIIGQMEEMEEVGYCW